MFWQNLPAPEVLSPEDTDKDEAQCVELSSLLAVPLMSRMTREELFSDRLNIPLEVSEVIVRDEMYGNDHILV